MEYIVACDSLVYSFFLKNILYFIYIVNSIHGIQLLRRRETRETAGVRIHLHMYIYSGDTP